MTRFVLIIAAIASGLGLTVLPGSAQTTGNAPWCAVINIGTGEIVHECYYQTEEQCAPNVVAGNRGFCNVNPYYRAPLALPPMRHSRRHMHYSHRTPIRPE